VRRSFPGIAASVFLLGVVPAQAASIGDVRALIDRGERARGRETLDAMLSGENGLTGKARDDAAILRADLEEDGATYEARLRDLLADDGGPAEARCGWLGHVLFARGKSISRSGSFRRDARRTLEEGGLGSMCALALGDPPSAREALQRAAFSGTRRVSGRCSLSATPPSGRRSGRGDRLVSAGYRRSSRRTGLVGNARLHGRVPAQLRRDDAAEILHVLLDTAPGSYDAPAARALLRALTPAPPAPEPTLAARTPSPEPPSGAPRDTASVTPSSDETIDGSQTAPSDGSFAVQLGAFTSEENAVALAAAARERTDRRVRILKGSDGLLRIVVGHSPITCGRGFGALRGIGASASVVPAPGD
jgi:cell division septation protein DedD